MPAPLMPIAQPSPPTDVQSAVQLNQVAVRQHLDMAAVHPKNNCVRCTASCSNTKNTGSCRPVLGIIRIIVYYFNTRI